MLNPKKIKISLFFFVEFDNLPKIPFSTDIGANPEMNIKACCLHYFDEANQIIPPLKIILKEDNKEKWKTY